MSSRALRKLQKDDLPGGDLEKESEGEASELSRGASANFNAFYLLNDGSCSESEVKEDDDQESARAASPAPTGAEKKKKRKKKKSNKKAMAARSSEDNLEDLDEVEASVKWVEDNLGPAADPGQGDESTVAPLRGILAVESKHLNPDNEMRRIFGSRVVQNESARHIHRKQRGRSHVRGTLLVTARPSWPSGGRAGLSMRPIESDKPGQWFTFDHSAQYQAVQMKFLEAVDSLNPDTIVALLNQHPTHIDSMLQLSEICKMGEDSAMASELVERTLYVCESSFHPCFNLVAGNCHLDYRRQENRAFFLALFRHIHFVGSRAAYRTSLELCKVLLSLDPESDPLGVVLMIDFYALRSREFQWLADIYTTWNPSRNLSQLPNFAYSTALAHFHISIQDPSYVSSADSMLQSALISFPGVLLPLLDKCSIEPDPLLQGHAYFLESQNYSSVSPALATLQALYVSRSYHCWKEPEVLPWLERNCKEALATVVAEEPDVQASTQARKSRYQGTPRNIHRHVVASDVQDALKYLPRELSLTPLTSWDPLPPLDSINTYVTPARATTAVDDPNALRMFFRSLLPNFNPNDPVDPAAAGGVALPDGAAGGDGGVPGQGTDLRNSVNSLLDAMRDLLGNLQLPEVPVDAGDEASGGEEEEWGQWD